MFDFNNKVEKLFIKASLCFEATESTSRFPRRLRSAINKAQRFVNSAPAKAFTMAEAIIVMTILGIIATIMITNLKPSEYRDKGLQVMAKKVLQQLDTATQQIMINNTQNGKLTTIYLPGTTTQVNYASIDKTNLGILYKKYLVTSRRPCTNEADCGFPGLIHSDGHLVFYLKDGSSVGITPATCPTDSSCSAIYPGEKEVVDIHTARGTLGMIFFDVNGPDEPNVEGKDLFVVGVNADGIFYD